MQHMSEGKDKTPEQITDEDYKVAPTSADEKYLNKKDAKASLQKKKRRNSKGFKTLSLLQAQKLH
jgi:hypothetical protein